MTRSRACWCTAVREGLIAGAFLLGVVMQMFWPVHRTPADPPEAWTQVYERTQDTLYDAGPGQACAEDIEWYVHDVVNNHIPEPYEAADWRLRADAVRTAWRDFCQEALGLPHYERR